MSKKQLVDFMKGSPRIVRGSVLRFVLRHQRIRKKTIIFEAYQGTSYACSPRALYEYMLHDDRFMGYEFTWVVRRPEKYKFLLSDKRTSVVTFRSFSYYLAFARAEYWIVNGWLPDLLVKKSGQTMIQCWHGTPLKRLRNDIVPDSPGLTESYKKRVERDTKDTLRYDYLVSPSRFASEKYISAFGLKELDRESIIIETGYPRNDFLYHHADDDADLVKRRLGIPMDKKVLLYTPTWRDDQRTDSGFSYKVNVDFDYLKKQLSDKYVVLFRAHYNVVDKFDFDAYKSFIFNVSDIDDVNELYVISDALITDYSSTMFDFANLKRPMLFFMYDLERYENKLRGFYFDLSELPGEIVKTEQRLAEILSDLKTYEKIHEKSYNRFLKKFNYLDDGNASRRVIERTLFNGEK